MVNAFPTHCEIWECSLSGCSHVSFGRGITKSSSSKSHTCATPEMPCIPRAILYLSKCASFSVVRQSPTALRYWKRRDRCHWQHDGNTPVVHHDNNHIPRPVTVCISDSRFSFSLFLFIVQLFSGCIFVSLTIPEPTSFQYQCEQ